MSRKLKPGDWVQIRNKEEILATLDANGALEGMLFMPEMLQHCGRRFQVYKRAHKSCDYTTAHPYVSRHIGGSVLLETRCDGSAHGGCQAGCTLLWKEAWLKPLSQEEFVNGSASVAGDDSKRSGKAACAESVLWGRTKATDPNDGLPRYYCQSTEIQKASEPLTWWDVRQYVEDYRSGNVSLRRLCAGIAYSTAYHLSEAGIGLGRIIRWFYDTFYLLWGGTKFPRAPGLIPEGVSTPTVSLNLQPGDVVRVKSHEEILKTVNVRNQNRGMYWDAELVPYCGGTYRVLKRVNKIIIEQTGKMMEMKSPCIILDAVVCQARYSSCRMFCPRAMYPYWREIWLERVEEVGSELATEKSGNNANRDSAHDP